MVLGSCLPAALRVALLPLLGVRAALPVPVPSDTQQFMFSILAKWQILKNWAIWGIDLMASALGYDSGF